MAPIHAKSPCCGAPVRRRGGRRKQCIYCKRTWSIRKKKRGRKRTRHTKALLKRILVDGHTLAQETRNFRVRAVSIAARFAVALRAYVATPPPRLPMGPYVLIVDGIYFKFQRREWVLYLMAVKPICSHRMYFLDPVLRQGREKIEVWYEAVSAMPKNTGVQIKGLVSDGLRGFQGLSEANGWVHQRCHFHLLSSLVRGKGKRRYLTRGSSVRDKVLHAIRIMLADESTEKRERVRRRLGRYITNPTCPAYVRKHVIEFLEREQDFRTYLTHPRLKLPTTTNAMESTNKLMRKATRTVRTPRSLLLRATAFLRLKRSVLCNGSTVLMHRIN
jgi:transposase-like protein